MRRKKTNMKEISLDWVCPYCRYKTKQYLGRTICPECKKEINKLGTITPIQDCY
jgi:Zn finger protein HypA/HybF involved in hydrogenase expression